MGIPGHAFANNNELIAFTELVNKVLVGGSTPQEQKSGHVSNPHKLWPWKIARR